MLPAGGTAHQGRGTVLYDLWDVMPRPGRMISHAEGGAVDACRESTPGNAAVRRSEDRISAAGADLLLDFLYCCAALARGKTRPPGTSEIHTVLSIPHRASIGQLSPGIGIHAGSRRFGSCRAQKIRMTRRHGKNAAAAGQLPFLLATAFLPLSNLVPAVEGTLLRCLREPV